MKLAQRRDRGLIEAPMHGFRFIFSEFHNLLRFCCLVAGVSLPYIAERVSIAGCVATAMAAQRA
jgi:hypothetical protein